jgi:hypothetical protein
MSPPLFLIYHTLFKIARGETMPNESLNIYLTAVEKAASAEGRA